MNIEQMQDQLDAANAELHALRQGVLAMGTEARAAINGIRGYHNCMLWISLQSEILLD